MREAGAELSPALIPRVRWESFIPAPTSQGQAGNSIALSIWKHLGSLLGWTHGCGKRGRKQASFLAERAFLSYLRLPVSRPRPDSLDHAAQSCSQLSTARPQGFLYSKATVFPIHPPLFPPPTCPEHLISPLKSVLFAKNRISYFKYSPLLFFVMWLSFWPCTHYTMLFWMPKTLPCSSDNVKQFPLCCFSLWEQQDILEIRIGFHLTLNLDNQVLWPINLCSNAKIWEDLKKLKMNPIDNRKWQKTDTFPIGTFHLGILVTGKIWRHITPIAW